MEAGHCRPDREIAQNRCKKSSIARVALGLWTTDALAGVTRYKRRLRIQEVLVAVLHRPLGPESPDQCCIKSHHNNLTDGLVVSHLIDPRYQEDFVRSAR